MKRIYTLFIYMVLVALTVSAQRDEVVQNRPYTDLRPLHLGIVVGTHLQDLEFDNVGLRTLAFQDGSQRESLVTCDQHNWDIGFNVGVLAEARMNQYFAFRFAPQLYFGSRNLKFHDYTRTTAAGSPLTETQNLRTVYVGADFDLIFAAQRHNNHRPYVMAGVAPMLNLSPRSSDLIELKKNEVFLEVGLGCDMYMPFFKLRPELKFMFGLTNVLGSHDSDEKQDAASIPYTMSVNKAMSKMIVLSFYFE